MANLIVTRVIQILIIVREKPVEAPLGGYKVWKGCC